MAEANTKRNIGLHMAAAGLLTIAGCVNTRTHANEFLIGYSRAQTYETLVPLILMWESDNSLGRRQALVIPFDSTVGIGGRLHSGPPASNPWGPCASDIACWPMGDIVAVVPTGTVLQVDHIERVRGWNWWFGKQDDLSPFAKFSLDGRTIEAEISDLSRFRTRTVAGKTINVPEPDPQVLRSSP